MNIVVINGTEVRGCTFAMKEQFLSIMDDNKKIVEYYLPKDCPTFCTGCKTCFFHDISKCPNAEYTVPIWNSIIAADLIVIACPTYALSVTGQMKTLLDHFTAKMIVHSPDEVMFHKQVVIIANAVGPVSNKAVKTIKDSLDFWGVGRVFVVKQTLFQPSWENVSSKVKNEIKRKFEHTSNRVKRNKIVTPRFKIKLIFFLMKKGIVKINSNELKAGRGNTKDYLYWRDKGWLDGKKPWK